MYDIELASQICLYRHTELIELAEKERLIKLTGYNQPGNQSLGAKIIALFKPSSVNSGSKGKTSRERSITDPYGIATR